LIVVMPASTAQSHGCTASSHTRPGYVIGEKLWVVTRWERVDHDRASDAVGGGPPRSRTSEGA